MAPFIVVRYSNREYQGEIFKPYQQKYYSKGNDMQFKTLNILKLDFFFVFFDFIINLRHKYKKIVEKH